ncbi:PREDICTED: V-set domain-containing T-cell activation inhibitor 1-like [Nanorana parkeri]|uniref:V-set domain-containing T-cell activation inhibitor 1-like n=1 Tax=Nanorana parkeri TaxID=125878 RepID=UPI0008545CD8|nr:PREDICTED: V-set domain-containing T-cell activation inhibitor 1-like [Nanorana parkeri]
MIAIIILLVAVIALIIGLSAAGNSTTNDVTTSNTVAQISGNVILGCMFTPDPKKSSDVLWEKDGVTGSVYKYENGKVSLTNQNSAFKGRTSLFLTELVNGNASLKLSNVPLNDAGTYKCTITNSKGTGSNKLSLNVGAFTPITVTNTTPTTLRCESPSWYPKPTVTWLNSTSQEDLTNSSITKYVSGLSVMVEVISDFTGAVEDMQYACIIKNNLAQAQAQAKFTVTGLKTDTRLDIISSAAILSPSVVLLNDHSHRKRTPMGGHELDSLFSAALEISFRVWRTFLLDLNISF